MYEKIIGRIIGLFAAGLTVSAMPAMAQVDINVNLGAPPAPVIYATPTPIYIQPRSVYVEQPMQVVKVKK